MLEAQTELASAENAVVQADVSYQRALNELDRTTGALLDRYQVQLAQAVR